MYSFTCVQCNKLFNDFHKVRKYCDQKCMGLAKFKGGWVFKSGYRGRNVGGKTVLEHRYLMEKHLGRKLRKDEYVDHINGNKGDNSLENLRVCTKRQNEHYYYGITQADVSLVEQRLREGWTLRRAIEGTTIKSIGTASRMRKALAA